MNTRWGTPGRACVGALIGAFAMLVLAIGVASASAATRTGVPIEGWSADRASSFWTPERMRNAVPVEIDGPGAKRDLAPGAAGASEAPPTSTVIPPLVAP